MPTKVALGIIGLALLQIAVASPSPGDADSVVAEEIELKTQEPTEDLLIQEVAKSKKKSLAKYAMTCVQRKEEALRTLMNYKASKTLKTAAKDFNVVDTKADWRLKQWHKRYIAAAASYAFFCEQSTLENDRVSKTMHEKEGLEAEKAALRGLQDATHKRKEKEAKDRFKAKESNTKKQAAAHEDKEKKLIKMMADEARLERLRSLSQSTRDLVGFVADASTGKGIPGVDILSACPFKTYSASTQDIAKTTGFSEYTMKSGVSGPEGYRCYLSYKKDGYIPLRYRILIVAEETQAVFRHSVLMPLLPTPPPYRIVLQYGTTPADIDAHLQVFPSGLGAFDISGHRGSSTDFTYSDKGSASALPFSTLDININNGYGPQTHTIHEAQVGTYGYYVKNQDHHYTDNNKFHDSDARVFVYEGNTLKHRFAIRNAQGTPKKYWQVFQLTCTKPSGSVTCAVNNFAAFVNDMPVSASIANIEQRR